MCKPNKSAEWIDQLLFYVVNLKKQPPMIQMGVGSGFGVVSGYFLTKGGRMVAATVGVTFLLGQYAIHKGYITLNESKIERDLKNLKKSISERRNNVPKLSDSFVSENRWILGGFAAGTLIGFSLA